MTSSPTYVTIRQYRSQIDCSETQKRTLQALGLRRINQSVEKKLTPVLEGMLKKVAHLVQVEKKQKLSKEA